MESFRVSTPSMRRVSARMIGRTKFPGAIRATIAAGEHIELIGTATGKATSLPELAAMGITSVIVRYNDDRDTMALPTRKPVVKAVTHE